jgi:3-oxoacyl-[acyl-carrier-protein] synthase-3
MKDSSLVASGRSRPGGALPIRISATGMYVPQRVVTNDDLASLGCDSDWIVQRTGIRERRFAREDEACSDLAYGAAVDCLQRAGVQASEVDLVLVATITQDFMTPSTACVLQQRLGCVAPAMDLNAACSGFLYGLIVASQFVATGAAKSALLVGSEVMSRTVNPADIKTYPLFGDGAGAVLLQPADEPGQGILASTLGAEGNAEVLCIPGGGSREPLNAQNLLAGRQFMQMDGRNVFKWAVRCVAESCRDVLAAAGYSIDQVDLVVLHQANVRIIDAALSDFGIAPEKVVVNLDRYGNTSAASVPLALDEAVKQGKLKRGSLVMLCGFGAGLTWGTALLRW